MFFILMILWQQKEKRNSMVIYVDQMAFLLN